jgi:hypothetical protein
MRLAGNVFLIGRCERCFLSCVFIVCPPFKLVLNGMWQVASVVFLALLYNTPFALSLSKGELLNYIEGFRSWFDMLTTNGL